MPKSYPLKKYRKNAKLTISKAAEKLGLTIGGLSDIEHKRELPTLDLLDEMRKLYRVGNEIFAERYEEDGRLNCPHCGRIISLE